MSWLRKLLGMDAEGDAAAMPDPIATSDLVAAPAQPSRIYMRNYGDRIVSVPSIDFMGGYCQNNRNVVQGQPPAF
jgi:hypothetical protein